MFRFMYKIKCNESIINCCSSFYKNKSGVNWAPRLSYCDKSSNKSSSYDPISKKDRPTAGFCILPAKTQDRGEILSLLARTFLKDEPLVVDVGLADSPSEDLTDHCVSALPENLSLVAVSPAGDIVGVAINGHQNVIFDTERHCADLAACKCPKTYKLLRFWAYIEVAACMRRFGVASVMELKVLATSPGERGRGIGKALIAASRTLARDTRYTLMRVDCTSHYSARAAERLGCDCVYSLDYEDYVGDDRQPVFSPPPPHCAVKVYTADLNT